MKVSQSKTLLLYDHHTKILFVLFSYFVRHRLRICSGKRPEIRVIGATAYWNVGLEETPCEDDVALLREAEKEDGEADHERNANAMDQSESIDDEDSMN